MTKRTDWTDGELDLFSSITVAPGGASFSHVGQLADTVATNTTSMMDSSVTPLKKLAWRSNNGVSYLDLLRRYSSQLGTPGGQILVDKIDAITIYEDSTTIGVVDIPKKNTGLGTREQMEKYSQDIPTLEEWEALIGAIPPSWNYQCALQTVARIDIGAGKMYWALDKNRYGANAPGIVAIKIGLLDGRITKDDSPSIIAYARSIRRLSDSEIASRHTVWADDPLVDYLVKMERFYAVGSTSADVIEFAKVKRITVAPEIITLWNIKLRRKKIGILNRADAQEYIPQTPTIAQWESIFQTMPGGSEWPKAMKVLLDIDLDKNLWEHDKHGRGGMLSVEKANTATRAITRDHAAPGMASLFVIVP